MIQRTCSREGCRAYSHFRGLCSSHLRTSGIPVPSPYERIMDKTQVNRETGCWEWRGRLASNGYGQIQANRRTLQVHRVTYEAHKGAIPEGLAIDHLCRNRTCCNPDHLEAVTSHENWRRGQAPNAISVRMGRCLSGRHLLVGENLYVFPNGVRRCRACHVESQQAASETKRLARIASGESRGRRSDRTHCPQGHPYDAENTRVSAKGSRSCRTCNREAQRRYKERRRAQQASEG